MNVIKEIGYPFPILTYWLGGDTNSNNEFIFLVAEIRCGCAVGTYNSWKDTHFLLIDMILSHEISQAPKLQAVNTFYHAKTLSLFIVTNTGGHKENAN